MNKPNTLRRPCARNTSLGILLAVLTFQSTVTLAGEFPDQETAQIMSIARTLEDARARRHWRWGPLVHTVDSMLLAACERVEQARLGAVQPAALSKMSIAGAVRVSDHGDLHCYVVLDAITDANLTALAANGFQLELAADKMGIAQGWLPSDRLEQVADLPFVRRIKRPDYGISRCQGLSCSAGDTIHAADQVRALGFDGTGVKVGVLSDGVNQRSVAQASNDLPAQITIHPTLGGNGEEGTAMLEIVHDLAPGAELFFSGSLPGGAPRPPTATELATGIDWMVSQGVDVIVDDIGLFGEPYFEDGLVATAARNAVLNGSVYCSAAGNECLKHYQGTFVDSDGAGTSNLHDFKLGAAVDQLLNFQVAPGQTAVVILQWNDAFGASGNNYDLGLFDAVALTLLASSVAVQDGDDDPIETIGFTNNTGVLLEAAVVVENFNGAAAVRELEIFSLRQDFADDDANCDDSVFGHPAAEGVVSCGAINASNPGNLNIANYSNQGPSTISFPTPQTRATPFCAAIDGVDVSGAGGFPDPFFGTSAAAPHAAAIAALVLDATNGQATEAQVRSALAVSASDRGAAGYDNTFGHGLLNAVQALTLGFPDADGDGVPDIIDACPGADDNADIDGDAVPDACDPCPIDNPDDTDGDGVCDSLDVCPGFDDNVDTDADTVADGCDLCPGFNDFFDMDFDGVPDGCDPCPVDAPDDTDGDGVCDSLDLCPNFDDRLDADGDFVPDACDVCIGFDDFADADFDLVPDGCDNCPLVANPNQEDDDSNSIGNACEPVIVMPPAPNSNNNCGCGSGMLLPTLFTGLALGLTWTGIRRRRG